MTDRKKYFICDEYTNNLAKLAGKATTQEELAMLCQRMYIADYINLENIDLWLAKNALTAAFQVLKKYPALRSCMHYFGTLKGFIARKDDLFVFLNPQSDLMIRKKIQELTDDIAEKTAVSFRHGGLALAFFASCDGIAFSGIILDETDFDERTIIKNIKYSSECGYNPMGCVSVRSVVDHELGHMLDFLLEISNSTEFRREIDSFGVDYVSRNLSKYCAEGGVLNYAEVLAEGFSEYRNHGAPRTIAKYIGALVGRKYRERKL